jgi:GAF domain-containing protein
MGSIGPDADNATATAYRTRAAQTMQAEPPSGGALVVPLVSADGCTGAMAIELRKSVEPSDYLRAVATILAAQLATLITPTPAAGAPHGTE